MDKSEIALQITLKILEKPLYPNEKEYNDRYAKEVVDFYNYVLNNIKDSDGN